MANLQPVEGNLPVVSEALLESTKGYIENARAENTLRAYRSDMKHFIEWAEGHGLQAMPAAPQTVSLYLSDLARQGYKPATLQRRLTAMSQAHKRSGYEFDTGHALIRETLGGIKRTCGTEQDQKEALLTEDIRAMVKASPDTRLGLRDRALLLLGFAGAFRPAALRANSRSPRQETPGNPAMLKVCLCNALARRRSGLRMNTLVPGQTRAYSARVPA